MKTDKESDSPCMGECKRGNFAEDHCNNEGDSGYRCSRIKGHAGLHVACGTECNLENWEQREYATLEYKPDIDCMPLIIDRKPSPSDIESDILDLCTRAIKVLNDRAQSKRVLMYLVCRFMGDYFTLNSKIDRLKSVTGEEKPAVSLSEIMKEVK